MLQKVLFLDIDGTLIKGKEELGYYVNKPEQVQIYPEVPAILKQYVDAGYQLCGVTNQLGIELGFTTRTDVHAKLDQMMDLLGYEFPVCIADKNNAYRKPKYGMLISYIERYLVPSVKQLDMELSMMVGDRTEDEWCAKNFGIKFQWAKLWRQHPYFPKLGDS